MVKNNILYIFIYVLLIGCGDDVMTNSCSSDCYLDMSAPSLQMDENGYYHIEFLDGYSQTFSTLDAKTGSDNTYKIIWDSDSGISYDGWWISSVNNYSYTNQGTAHTVLSVWEENINDTITIYADYIDDCEIQHSDSIKVVVE